MLFWKITLQMTLIIRYAFSPQACFCKKNWYFLYTPLPCSICKLPLCRLSSFVLLLGWLDLLLDSLVNWTWILERFILERVRLTGPGFPMSSGSQGASFLWLLMYLHVELIIQMLPLLYRYITYWTSVFVLEPKEKVSLHSSSVYIIYTHLTSANWRNFMHMA